MAQNSSTTPATAGNELINGTTSNDQLTGGGGSDTINGNAGDDSLTGDAPLLGQWQYSVYDYDFQNVPNQTQFIANGTLVGQGYVDDFNILALRNRLSGLPPTQTRADYGVIYRSTMEVPVGGNYRFFLRSDDGSRLIIRDQNGNVILNLNNDTNNPSLRTEAAFANLAPGQTYSIEIQYWHNDGPTGPLDQGLLVFVQRPNTPGTEPLDTSPLIQAPPPAPGNVDGNDLLNGGAGNDTLLGNGGDDSLYGGTDQDQVHGGTGQDLIHGDSGSDSLFGGSGGDSIYGGTGTDSVEGGDGNDLLFGGSDNDSLTGGADEDSLNGDDGSDRLDGGDGNDRLFGGAGADSMLGGGGNDVLFGGSGIDSQFGGDGRDLFVYQFGDVGIGEVVVGGEGGDDYDVLDISALGATYGWNNVVLTYTSTDPSALAGIVRIFAADGVTLLGTIDFSEIEEVILCFAAGTLVDTPDGARPVEALRPGDLVLTLDDGPQPLRWVGRRRLGLADLLAEPSLVPVEIGPGALGPGLPNTAITVSPQHRILLQGGRCELYLGEAEALAPAVHLTGLAGIGRPLRPVTYVHLMFDRHQIVRTAGLWSESFQPGDRMLAGMPSPQRDELLRLFPGLATAGGYGAARMTLRAHETRLVLAG